MNLQQTNILPNTSPAPHYKRKIRISHPRSLFSRRLNLPLRSKLLCPFPKYRFLGVKRPC